MRDKAGAWYGAPSAYASGSTLGLIYDFPREFAFILFE